MHSLSREVAWPCATSIARSILIGTAIASAVTLAGMLARTSFHDQPPREDRAALVIATYALEAFPAWVAAHPDRACPRSLAELDAYVDRPQPIDPWGTRYHFACGEHVMPRTAQGIWIISAGEDRLFGTADDIRSDRR